MTFRGRTESKTIWIVLLLATFMLSSGMAMAQDDAEEADADDSGIEKIAITGSRIKRTDIEGPANVIVLDGQELDERGYTTVFEALSDLTMNNGFKFEGPETTNGFSPDVQTINLRGFGIGTTLTLINGRRLANYPVAYQSNETVFSYGSIPVSAIERIEILTTGASAIYGSDAVAGVVNIILRSDIEGTTVNALWGTPTETDSTRGDTRIQIVNGHNYNRGSYTFTVEYANRSSILGRHYDEYDSQQDDYPYGEGFYNRTLLTLDQFKGAFGIYPRYRDPVEITGQSGDAACSATDSNVYAFRTGAGYYCTNPLEGVPSINFQNEKESVSAYFNGQLEIGDNGMEVFTDLLYYSSNSKSVSNGMFFVEDILDLTKPDTVEFGFFDWYSFQRFFTEADHGLDTDIKYDDQSYSGVVGIRGILADVHDWELSVNYSKAEYEQQNPWMTWDGAINNFLGTWLGVGFFGLDWWSGGTLGEDMPAGFGIPSNLYGGLPASARDAFAMQTYQNEASSFSVNFTMSGDILEMPAGPLSYAAVVEYEETELTYIPDSLMRQLPPTEDINGDPVEGLTGSGWYRLTGYHGDGTRERYSVGAELRIPVLPTVNLNLAARWDDYDSTSTSFGSDITPSASIEWRPVDPLLLRAGYTESFRAPDMALVFVNTGSFQTVFDYVNCLDVYVFQNGSEDGFDTADCEAVNAFTQRVGSQDLGLPALDAEKGDSWWAGFAWDIMDNLSLSVDYTSLQLEQRVLSQSTQGILDDEYSCLIGDQPSTITCDQVPNQIIRGVDPTTGIRFIKEFYRTSINQYSEEASFVDVKINYNLSTEVGLFGFQADYNNVVDHTQQVSADSDEINLRDDPVNGGWEFRASFVGSISWTYQDFSTTVTGIYRGGTTKFRCTTATNGCVGQETGEDYLETGNYRGDDYTTFNWTASYNWTDAFLTRLRVVNVFDEDPPYDDTHQFIDQPWYNIYVYPGAGIGRYAALEAEFTF